MGKYRGHGDAGWTSERDKAESDPADYQPSLPELANKHGHHAIIHPGFRSARLQAGARPSHPASGRVVPLRFNATGGISVSMQTSESATHLPPLGGLARDEVMRCLQQTLVELVDLSLVGKQLHWTVIGELFRPLHAQLDELVDSWRELADTVAERLVSIGGNPDAQASAVASGSGWELIESRPVDSQEAVRVVARRLAEATERLRDRAHRLGELDLASQDVAIQVLRELETQLWMVRVQFSGRIS